MAFDEQQDNDYILTLQDDTDFDLHDQLANISSDNENSTMINASEYLQFDSGHQPSSTFEEVSSNDEGNVDEDHEDDEDHDDDDDKDDDDHDDDDDDDVEDIDEEDSADLVLTSNSNQAIDKKDQLKKVVKVIGGEAGNGLENFLVTCINDGVSKSFAQMDVENSQKEWNDAESVPKTHCDIILDNQSRELDIDDHSSISSSLSKEENHETLEHKSKFQVNEKSIKNDPSHNRIRIDKNSRNDSNSKKKDLESFFDDTRFFLIKSANVENVILSKAKGVWSTTPRNEQLFNKAYKRHRNVVFLFSVERSQAYQGFCRMASESSNKTSPVNWVMPPGLRARVLGGVFRVEWLNKIDLPFKQVNGMFNKWNNDKPVKIARDGTELEPSLARRICRLFPTDPSVDLHSILINCRASNRREQRRANCVDRPLTPPGSNKPLDVSGPNAYNSLRIPFRRRSSPPRRPASSSVPLNNNRTPFTCNAVRRSWTSNVANNVRRPNFDSSSKYLQRSNNVRRSFQPPVRRQTPQSTTTTTTTFLRKTYSRPEIRGGTTRPTHLRSRSPVFRSNNSTGVSSSSKRREYDDLLMNGSYNDYIRHFSSSYGNQTGNFMPQIPAYSYSTGPMTLNAYYSNPYHNHHHNHHHHEHQSTTAAVPTLINIAAPPPAIASGLQQQQQQHNHSSTDASVLKHYKRQSKSPSERHNRRQKRDYTSSSSFEHASHYQSSTVNPSVNRRWRLNSRRT